MVSQSLMWAPYTDRSLNHHHQEWKRDRVKINLSAKQYDFIFTKKVELPASSPSWGTESTWWALLCVSASASVSASALITHSVGVSYLCFPGEITCAVMVATAYIYHGRWTHEEANWNLGKAQESKLLSSLMALFHRTSLFPKHLNFVKCGFPTSLHHNTHQRLWSPALKNKF